MSADEDIEVQMEKDVGFKTDMELLLDKARKQLNRSPVIVFMGKTGTGKSSLGNALFGKDAFKTNDTVPETSEVSVQDTGDIILVDVPGIGEAVDSNERKWRKLYKELMTEGVHIPGAKKPVAVDLIVWLIKADDRALKVDSDFYQKVFVELCTPAQLKRIIYAVSQADKIEPIRGEGGWNEKECRPGAKQEANLDDKRKAVADIFDISINSVIPFSAQESWNLAVLLDEIVRRVPKKKAPLLIAKARKRDMEAKRAGSKAPPVVSKPVEDYEDDIIGDVIGDIAGAIWGEKGKRIAKLGYSKLKSWLFG